MANPSGASNISGLIDVGIDELSGVSSEALGSLLAEGEDCVFDSMGLKGFERNQGVWTVGLLEIAR